MTHGLLCPCHDCSQDANERDIANAVSTRLKNPEWLSNNAAQLLVEREDLWKFFIEGNAVEFERALREASVACAEADYLHEESRGLLKDAADLGRLGVELESMYSKRVA